MNETISIPLQQELLRLAREAIVAHFKKLPSPVPKIEDPLLLEKRGIFVTLTNHGHLRGCIGTFDPEVSLGKIVGRYAVASLQDPRFQNHPITLEEVPALEIGISILSPLRRIVHLEEIQLGVHGIRVSRGNSVGCFLPEVAEEQGWNVQQFVEYCLAHKAHLSKQSLQDPQLCIEIFTTTKIQSEGV